MRVCSRCKDISKRLGTTLQDKKDATEYDLCSDCLEEFKEVFLNPINQKNQPKKKAEKKE